MPPASWPQLALPLDDTPDLSVEFGQRLLDAFANEGIMFEGASTPLDVTALARRRVEFDVEPLARGRVLKSLAGSGPANGRRR